jgi:hypothetical protein
MPVTQASATALEQNHLLAVIGYIAKILTCLSVISDGSAGDFNDNVITVLAETLVAAAVSTVLGKSVTLIAQMQQCPVVAVTLKDNASALTAVTAVGTAVRDVFVMTQMGRSATALARPAKDLYVIYKI